MTAADLRLAAGRNQLRLAFAPLLDAGTRAVAGFVAHAWWAHPDDGPVSPERLRPVAERFGLTRALDAWTTERVGTVLAGWPAGALDALALLAVVVGSETLADLGAHRYTRAVADLTGLPPDRLRLVGGYTDLAAFLAHRNLAPTTVGAVPPEVARRLLRSARKARRRGDALAASVPAR